jgi:amino acid transporter
MGLHRAIGTWGLTALGVNAIIGSGIFFLPGPVNSLVGPASLVAVVLAMATSGAIALCYAEVGSHFTGTGGALLYAEQVYGTTAGFTIGWIQWLARLATWAAVANAAGVAVEDLVHTTIGQRPGWVAPLGVLAVLSLVTWANLRGVRQGVWVSGTLTVLKLATLALFVAIGVWAVSATNLRPFAPRGYGELGAATLLIFYAFAGFEGLCVPSGELRNPERTLVRGLVLTMLIVGVVYLAVVFVTLGVAGAQATGDTAVLEAAQRMLGQNGRIAMSVALLISLLGINAAMSLITSRCLLALAERRMLPARLGWVSESRGTPDVALLLSAAIALGLALSGRFAELAGLSVVGRFIQYIPTCIALPILRRRKSGKQLGDATGIQLPFGELIALVAVALSVWIVSKASGTQWIQTLAATALGFVPYLLARKNRPAQGD